MSSSIKYIESKLITIEENNQVFCLLGPECQALATAIVQLYVTQGPRHQNWIKMDSGVMCFEKDYLQRNYFFRLYCLIRNKMIWEQECYADFNYKCPHNYFHMFEIDDRIAGLNFASTHEAAKRKITVQEKLTLKQYEERRYRNSLRNNQSTSIPNGGAIHSTKKDKKRPIKLTKDDINLPQGFVHISHVGWDPHKGSDVDVEDSQLRKFFDKAGVSDKQFEDKETRDFILDFTNKHGKLTAKK